MRENRFTFKGFEFAVLGLFALAFLFSATAAVASAPPSIESESVSGITSTDATLEAQIDPHEGNAFYQFQLVTNTGEYASEILCPEPPETELACIGTSAAGALPIGFLFEGETQASLALSSAGVTLQPGATYHYRVLAARAVQTEDTIEWEPPAVLGTDHTFTTLSTSPLTIAKTGEGTVVSSPGGIECTGAKTGAECESEFEKNELVTLTASPAPDYAFSSWSGCTQHVGLTCEVTMSAARTVKASFVATPLLTVEKSGSGQGKVAASGISCDENCSKATSAIKTGTVVTVKTVNAKGSEAAFFENGTGSAASGCSGATCSFTITAKSSVKVKFDAIPTKTLTVNLTGPAAYKGKVSGKGIVKGLTTSAINCGAGCTSQTESFFSTDEVTLSAAAGTGYTFGGWSGSEAGTCTGKTSPCAISTSANKTLSAKFE
jgi:uncharacterized repeat protein (TIGR02543 family)